MTYRKHTSVTDVLTLIGRHRLADIVERVAMCSCGRWFTTPAGFSEHLLEEAQAQLTASAPRGPAVTRQLLCDLAEIHRAADDGTKTRAVAEFLGVSPRSAGTYVSRARKAGLLEPSTRRAA